MTMEAQVMNLPPPEPVDIETSSLLLDFDGTLIPIAETPDAVVVDGQLLDLLTRLADAMAGRIAIISGRSIAQLDVLLGQVAGLVALSGSHGSEFRWNGVEAQPDRPPELTVVAEQFQSFIKDRTDMLVEIKSYGVALHYRRAPQEAEAVNAMASAVAVETGLAFQPGHMVAEIRLPGSDKGVAVTNLMSRAPMQGTMPIFLGDDATDEAALIATGDLGGMPIAVGPRPTNSAQYGLSSPRAVREWLEGLLA